MTDDPRGGELFKVCVEPPFYLLFYFYLFRCYPASLDHLEVPTILILRALLGDIKQLQLSLFVITIAF